MSEHDKNLSRRKSPNHASFPRPNVLAVALLGGASAVAVRTCRTLKRLREGNKLSRVAPAPDSDFPTAPSRSLSSCMIIEPVDRADEALRLPKGETPMPLELRVWSCTVKYIVIPPTAGYSSTLRRSVQWRTIVKNERGSRIIPQFREERKGRKPSTASLSSSASQGGQCAGADATVACDAWCLRGWLGLIFVCWDVPHGLARVERCASGAAASRRV